MNKIKTVKIKNKDGSISEESYPISVNANLIDMNNGYDLQETIGNIDVNEDGSIAEQLKHKLNNDYVIDNLESELTNKALSANQGRILNNELKKKAYFFNTVEDMKKADLKEGDYVSTLGYYEVNDGGGAEYKIISFSDNYAEILNNNLKAMLITKNIINIKQFGVYGNNIQDDTSFIQKALEYAEENNIFKILIPNGNYLISSPIYLYNNCSFIGLSNDCNFTITNNYQYAKLFSNKENSNNIVIKSININMDNKSFTSQGNITRGIMAFEGVNGIKIENCKLQNNYDLAQITENQPIWLQSCSNIKIVNNSIIHYGIESSGKGNGIWIFCKNSDIKNIEIINNYFEGYGDEFIALFAGSYNYKIKNVIIENNNFIGANIYRHSLSYNK